MWREKDSNLRSLRRQIYSLIPLTARESLHIFGLFGRLYFQKYQAIHPIGAGDGTRTRNLLITNQLLYQLSYASAFGLSIEEIF